MPVAPDQVILNQSATRLGSGATLKYSLGGDMIDTVVNVDELFDTVTGAQANQPAATGPFVEYRVIYIKNNAGDPADPSANPPVTNTGQNKMTDVKIFISDDRTADSLTNGNTYIFVGAVNGVAGVPNPIAEATEPTLPTIGGVAGAFKHPTSSDHADVFVIDSDRSSISNGTYGLDFGQKIPVWIRRTYPALANPPPSDNAGFDLQIEFDSRE